MYMFRVTEVLSKPDNLLSESKIAPNPQRHPTNGHSWLFYVRLLST